LNEHASRYRAAGERRPFTIVIRRLEAVRALPAPLAILAGMTFLASLGISMMIPLLPLYGLALGASPVQLGLMTSAFAVTNAVAQFGGGFLNDRFGPRPFIAGGMASYAAANALIAAAPNAVALIAFRAIAGLGAGANLVSARLYISHVTPGDRLSFANAIISAAQSAGNVAGPAIGGLLAAALTLRAPFAAVALTSGLASVAAFFLPPVSIAGAREGETALAEPVVNRKVVILTLSNFLLLTGFGGWITSYAPFAQGRLGWTTFEVGILFTFFAIGDVTLGPWIGRIADRSGRKRVAVVAGFPVALFGLALVLELPRLVLYGTAYLAGAGLTAFFSSWYALLTIAVPAALRGRVFGIVSAIGNLGTVAGALGAAAIWERADLRLAVFGATAAAFAASVTLLLLPDDRSEPARAPTSLAATGA
jgi:DHA1 family tetracycline resistance protein-like MFS transporter